MYSLAEDSKVQATSSHTYTAEFPDHWCIGSVPHGGFVTTCFQQVASKHFATTLSKQNQPHTMTMHLSFLRRTEVGLATFIVKDVKLGLRTSTLHIALSQHDREEVVAYIVQTNMTTEAGVSFPTSYTLHPPPRAVSLTKLEQQQDEHWAEAKMQPYHKFRKAVQHMRFFFPRVGQSHPSTIDQWIKFASGENFTDQSLGFVVDMFPQLIEAYRADGKDPFAADMSRRPTKADAASHSGGKASYWYPTVLLNLDVKKALPEDGVKWLFVRIIAKAIRDGRFDMEVLVYDESNELVALSHHVALVVDASRNLAKRKEGPGKEKL